jgi:drug/metabolite transporter (DMT)-like permease
MQPEDKSRLTGTLWVLGAVVAWGAYFPYAKLVLQKVSPSSFLIIRLGVGAATLYLLNVFLKKSLRIRRSDWLFVIAAGAIGIIAHQLIQLTGLKVTSATNTGWILTLNPPVAGILGWLILKERVGIQKIIGLVIAMFGVALLVSKGHPSQLSLLQNWGDTLALISIGTWAVYSIMLKSRLTSYEPLAISAFHMLLGFVFFAVVGGTQFAREAGSMTVTEWVIAIAIGVLPSGLAYYWWTAGLRRLSVIDISMFLFIEAIVASLAGWAVLGESFTALMVLATIVIIFGVWFAETRRFGKRVDIHTT